MVWSFCTTSGGNLMFRWGRPHPRAARPEPDPAGLCHPGAFKVIRISDNTG